MKSRLRNGSVIAAILACVGLIAVTLNLRRQDGALQAYERELTARGEKLTIAENIPPAIPPEENSANIIQQALSLLTTRDSVVESNPPFAMHMADPGGAVVGWMQPEIRGQKVTNTWNDIEEAIRGDDAAFALVEKAIEHPHLDFHRDYSKGFNLLLPHLERLKYLTERLSAAAICDLHHGDSAAAAMRIRASLVPVIGLRGDRTTISQLVRTAMAQISIKMTWELLQATNLTEARILSLQRDWQKMEFIEGFEAALSMDRAMAQDMTVQIRQSPSRIHDIYGLGSAGSAAGLRGSWLEQVRQFAVDGLRKTRQKGQQVLWQVAWSYPDQLRSLRGYQVLLEATRTVRTNGGFASAWETQTNKLGALGILVEEDDSWLRFVTTSDDIDLRRIFQWV